MPLAVMETMRRLPTDPFADLMVTQNLAADDAMWLRYDYTTGAVRTGALTADGIAIVLRDIPFDRGWSHLLALGDARIAAYSQPTGLLTVGEVGADGRYADVRDNPAAETAHTVVTVLPNTLMFYLVRSTPQGYAGTAVVGRIASNGAYSRLSEPYLFDFWTHIVPVQDGLVLFYNAYSRMAATGRVTGDGGFADLQNHPGFDEWTGITAMSDGTLLFYNSLTGAAASGRVSPDGGFVNLHSHPLSPGMSFRATRDGRVLISRPADTLVARFTDGWFSDTRIVNGLILPMPTLFVR